MTRLPLLLAALALAPVNAHAEGSVNYWLKKCDARGDCEKAISGNAQYIAASVDNLLPRKRVCLPSKASDKEVYDGIMNFLSRHPERRDENMTVVLDDAVRDLWPCPSQPSGPATFEEMGCRGNVCGVVGPDGKVQVK